MPGYSGRGQAQTLYGNRQVALFLNEALAVNVPSVAYQLRRTPNSLASDGFSVEATFSGAPGAFQVNVEGADQDDPTHYVVINQLSPQTSPVNSSNVARVYVPGPPPRYVRVNAALNPNGVTGTVLLTR